MTDDDRPITLTEACAIFRGVRDAIRETTRLGNAPSCEVCGREAPPDSGDMCPYCDNAYRQSAQPQMVHVGLDGQPHTGPRSECPYCAEPTY